MKRKTFFQKQLDESFPGEFIVIGDYVNNRTKVDILHKECGRIALVHPSSIISGKQSKCSFCKKRNDVDNGLKEYIERNSLAESFSYDIGEAQSVQSKIKFKCLTCDSSFLKTSHSFKAGQGCPYCSGAKTNIKIAKIRIIEKFGKDYQLLTKNLKEHVDTIEILHLKCRRISKTSYSYFIKNSKGCLHCTRENSARKRSKTNEQFLEEVETVFGSEYIPLTEYIKASEMILMLHTPCMTKDWVRARNIATKNFGCRHCNMSTPETIINNMLETHEIEYEFQYTQEGCRGKRGTLLPFDFALKNADKSINCIIEYDGEHHFSSEPFGKESYERTVFNDRIKNEFCVKENIKLYRIPYYELPSIKDIIENILYEQSLI